jgi:hypothetical protein
MGKKNINSRITKGLILIFVPVFCVFFSAVNAQTKAQTTYNFLNFYPSARLGATNGTAIAIKDYESTLAYQNPSLLNSEMSEQISINYVNYISDANYGVIGYVSKEKKQGIFSASLTYLNYGKFTQTDETSAITGNFSASDYCLSLGWGKKLNEVISVGGNFKTIYSAYETYRSFGLAIDLAGHYQHPGKLFSATVLARNVGAQLKSYSSSTRNNLPLQTQAAIAYKLEHVPLRFLIMYDNIHNWKLYQPDTTKSFDPISGQEIVAKSGFGKNLSRHFSLGAEFLISKYFNLRFGYQIRRQQELKMAEKAGLIGFSAGVGFKLSKFIVSYGWGKYHFFGNSNHISLIFKPSDFHKKS